MEKGFQVLRSDEGYVPLGSAIERIVGRAAIRKFAVDYGARKAAEREPVEGRG
jgi:hypothetical protein